MDRNLAADTQNDAPVALIPNDAPVTLHRIMQTMIGEGLRERYQAPKKLSHQLFVLMMQMKEVERQEARRSKLAAVAGR